jgi:IS1 family transposase
MVFPSSLLVIGIMRLSNSSGDLSLSELHSIYQILDNHFVDKEYTVESYNSYCRAHLARLARTVNRSERMVEYSLALLNVMYPHVFSRGTVY